MKRIFASRRGLSRWVFASASAILALTLIFISAPATQAATEACTTAEISGGAATVTRSGSTCRVVIKASGTTWTRPASVKTISIILIGGGGGGGFGSIGGGGGAGEVLTNPTFDVSASSSFLSSIGSGGAGGWNATQANWSAGGKGGSTVFGSITAGGGGGGGGDSAAVPTFNSPGGSSGGATNGYTAGAVPSWTSISGFTRLANVGGNNSGGGGGAGNFGGDNTAGQGGIGITNAILTSASINGGKVAGGGNSWAYRGTNTANGYGGGIAVGNNYTSSGGVPVNNGTPGTANTGGGGGAGMAGGSGVIAFEYTAGSLSVTNTGDLGAVAGQAFLNVPKIQLKKTDGTNDAVQNVQVDVTTSAGSTLFGTTSANTDSTGLATFTGLGLNTGTLGTTYTLTFSAAGYYSTTTTVVLRKYPDRIDVVTTSSDANGVWSNGTWLTTTTGVSNINATALGTAINDQVVSLRTPGSFYMGPAVTATTAGKGIKIAAGDYIGFGGLLTLNNGSVTLLSNADATIGSNPGNIFIDGAGSGITTGGGAIVMAGGSYTETSGFAVGHTTSTSGTAMLNQKRELDNAGIYISGSVNSGGGSISMNGQIGSGSADSAAIYVATNGSIQGAGGSLNLKGLIGIDQTDTTASHRSIRVTNGSITTTGSGTISVIGVTSATNSAQEATLFENATISAVNGNITIDAQNHQGASRGLNFVTANSTISTSGTGSISMTAANSTNGDQFTNLTNLSAGGSISITSVKSLTLPNAWSTAGSLTLESTAGSVTVNANQTITGSGNKLLLKAADAVIFGPSITIQTNGGDIVAWSDSNSTAGGYIKVDATVTMRSNGGKIWLAGGADDGGTAAGITAAKGAWSSLAGNNQLPDGYAQGNSTQLDGVFLSTDHLLYSAGGDIFIAGMNTATANNNGSTIKTYYGTIDSGAGRIAMWGKAAATGYYTYGINLHYYSNSAIPQVITSSNKTAQAITIYGDSGPSTNSGSDGFMSPYYTSWLPDTGHQGLRVLATGLADASNPGGTINITGIGSSTNGQNGGDGVHLDFVDLLAKAGSINVTGYESDGVGDYSSRSIWLGGNGESWADTQSQNLVRFGAWTAYRNRVGGNLYTNQAGVQTDFTTSASDINLLGDKMGFIESSDATYAPEQGYKFTTSGDIAIQPTSASFAVDQSAVHWYFARTTIAGTPSSFTLGKDGNTANVTWWYQVSSSGPIKIYGGDLHLYQHTSLDLITTMDAASSGANKPGILLKAAGKLYLTDNLDLTTSGADITLWSDFDNNGSGSIWLEGNNKLKSAGGKITLAGGLDDAAVNNPDITGRVAGDGYPDNYATGIVGWSEDSGVMLHPDYVLASGGGDIFISGKSSDAATTGKYGADFYYGLVYAGTGKIAIYGKLGSSTSSWGRALVFGWGADNAISTSIVSDSTATDAIKIFGDAAASTGAASTASFGIESFFNNRFNVIATGTGGGIEITGKNSDGTQDSNSQYSSPVELNYVNILAKSGPINISGTSSVANDSVLIGSRGTGQNNVIGYSSAAVTTPYSELSSVTVSSSTSPISITGSGGRVYLDATIKTSFATKTLNGALIKSTAGIELGASSSVTTGGGRATFWSRSASTENTASQTGEGAVTFGDGVSVSTNGGAITIAGSSSSSDNLPTGHAYTNVSSGYTINLGTSGAAGSAVSLNSANGPIRIYSQSGPSARMAFAARNSATTISSGTGRQDMDFVGGNSVDNVFESWGPLTITSSALADAATPAIKISIRQNNSANSDTPIQQQGTYAHTFAATGGGDISFTVSTAHATAYAVDYFRDFYFLASGGKIAVDLGANGIDLANATTSDKVIFGVDGTRVTSSTATVEITSGKFVDNATNGSVIVKTNGAATIQPKTGSFLVDQIFDGTWAFSGNSTGNVGGITFGKSGNTSGITLSGANTAAGDINVYAAASTISANQTTTGSGNINIVSSAAVSGAGNLDAAGNITISGTGFSGTGTTKSGGTTGTSITASSGHVDLKNSNLVTALNARFLAKASGNVSTTSAATIRTNSGKIVLWSDSDANGGTVTVVGTICTAPIAVTTCNSTVGADGDDVIIGGAAASLADATLPGGYATGSAVDTKFTSTGVQLGTLGAANNSGPKIYTYGGNVQIAGQTATGAVSEYTYGVNLMVATEIHSSAGKISIVGKNNANSSSTAARLGVELNGWGSTGSLKLVSTNTDDDSIMIKALSTNTTDTVGFNSSNIGSEITSSGGVKIQSNHIASDAKIKWAVAKTIVLEPVDTSFSAALDFDGDYTFTSNPGGLRLGKAGNAIGVTTSTAVTATGPIEIYASTATINSNLTTGTSSTALIKADTIAINTSNTITSTSGVVTLAPATTTMQIDLGTETAGKLSLTSAELNRISAGTIRIGELGGSNTGAITVSADIAPSGTTNLALRTGGNITGSGIITETNLGLAAGGTINLTGMNVIGGNLAITAGGASGGSGVGFSSGSGNYTAGNVDSITGVFGVPTAFTMSQVPVLTPTDAFMAVAFNPPPIITFKDNYGYAIQAANTLGDTQSVTATKASGSGTLAGTTTLTSTDGVATFNNLKIESGTGSHTITFTSGSINATTQSYYNVLAGEPSSLVVSMTQTSLAAGKAFNSGTRPTVTLKDVGGNTIASGTHATATVTATLIGTGGTVVAGQTKPAVAGVATFDTLALAGTVGGTYSVRYSVTYTNTSSVQTTVNSTDTGITFTPGDATLLEVTTPASNATNRAVFTTQPKISIKDAYGNVVTGSTAEIVISESSADIALAGTTTMNAVSGVADFSTNTTKTQLNGKKATGYTLTYTAASLSLSNTQTIDLTYGAATKLALTTEAAGFVNRENFTTQPQITIQDADGNTVENSTSVVTVAMSNGNLTGTTTASPTNGVATFSGLGKNGLVGTTKVLTFTADNLTQVQQSAFTLTPGTPTKLMIDTPADGFTNGVAFTTQPSINLTDFDGNTATGVSTGSVSVAVGTGVGGGTAVLTGTTTQSVASGVASFSANALTLTGKVDTYRLTYSLGSYTSAFQDVTLVAGTATKLAVTTAPVGFVNRVAFTTQPVVTVQDASGNTVTNSSAQITAGMDFTTLAGTTTVNAQSGIADWSLAASPLTPQTIAGTRIIYFDSPGLTQARFTFVLSPGAATQIQVSKTVNASSAGVPLYYPSGPQTNVPRTLLTNGGWTECYRSSFNQAGTTLEPAVKAACTGTYIMMGGLATGSDTLLLAAAAPTSDVFTVTSGNNTKTLNNSNWYYVPGGALGFVTSTRTPSLNACDGTYVSPNSFCLHLTNNGGYRIGSITGLNGSGAYERVFYQSNGGVVSGAQANDASFTSQPIVTIRDLDSNIVTSGADSTKAITISGAGLSGTLTVNAVAGVANFSGLKYTGTSGSRTFTYAATGSGWTSRTETVTINAGVATKLGFGAQAAGAVNDVAFTTQPTIEVQDVSGNKVTTSTASITAKTSAGATLGGTVTNNATSGALTFSGLKLTGAAGDYTLTYESSGLTSLEQSITNAPGAATKLIQTTLATNFVNRQNFDAQPVIEVRDASNNLVTTNTDEITVSISDATLTGTTTVRAVGGIATFSGLGKYGQVGSKKLTFSSGSLAVAEQPFTLTFGAATKLTKTTPAAGFTNAVAFTTQPIIKVQDQDGNTVTDYVGSVTVGQSGGTLDGNKVIAVSQGVATYTDLKLSGASATSYTLTFSAPNVTNETQTFTLGAGAAHHLAIIQLSSTAENRINFATQPIIEVQDITNNPVPNSGLTITAASTGLTLDGTKTATADASTGRATFTGLSLRGFISASPSTQLNFTTTGGVAAVGQSITVTHGAATKLSVNPTTHTAINNATFATTPVVTITDEDGNKVINSTKTVSVTVAPSSGSTNPTSTDGFADQTFTSTGELSYPSAKITGKAQDYNVTYAATGLASAVQTVTLGHAAASQLVKIAMPTSAKAGIGFTTNPKFEIQDASGNVVNTGAFATATVSATVAHNSGNREQTSLRTAGANASPVNATAVLGVVEFTDINLVGDAGDNYDISFTIATPTNSIAANTQTVALNAGDPNKLAITEQPLDVVAGATFTTAPKAQIQDAWNNPVGSIASNYAIKADLVTTDNATVEDNTQSAVTVSGSNDTATFSAITFNAKGNHKLRFSSTPSLVTAVSNQFAVTNAPAHHLVWVNEGSTTVRNGYVVATAPKLKIVDQFGNAITDGAATTVTVTATGSNAADVASINGATATNTTGSEFVEFTNLKLNAKIGAYKLRFTATNAGKPINNAYTDLTGTITVTFGDATKLAVATPGDGARAGMALSTQPIIEVRDANDNVVADSTLTIEASAGDLGYEEVGTTTKRATAGIANFAGTGFGIAGTAGTGKVLNFSTILVSGSAVNTTQTIELTAGTAHHLAMGTQPSTVQTGATMSPAPTVTVQDQWNNPVLTDSSTQIKASLYRGANATGAQYISGQTSTKTASAGTATFSGLQVVAPSKTGYTYRFVMLDGSANPTGAEIESSSFEITPGAPNSIVILKQPNTDDGQNTITSRTKSGDRLKIQPSVQLLDADGNVATHIDSGSITISVNGAGGSVAGGQTTATLTDGVATFNDVKLSGKSARTELDGTVTAATGYTFTFTYSAITKTTATPVTVDHNVAHHLTLVRNAGTTRAGIALEATDRPIVEIRDADNNLVNTGTEASSTIFTTAKNSVTNATAVVAGTRQRSASAGVAEMSVGIEGQVTNSYTYTFSVLNKPAITTASQSGITVTHGFASQLVMTTQPGSLDANNVRTKTGDALAVQPVLEFQDAYGNRVLDAGSDYEVVATISGTQFDVRDRLENSLATSSSGVVTFSSLKLIGRPGHDYTLLFTWSGQDIQREATQTVAVTHADAHHLTITRQPATGTAPNKTKTGDRLATQPRIEVRDFDDNVVTTNTAYATVPLTAAITTGGGSTTAVDGGTANIGTVAIVNGVADFTDLKVVATPNTAQKLTFSGAIGLNGATLTSAESDAFELTHADAAKLAIITQPCTGSLDLSSVCQAGPTGGVMAVQPTVQVQDRFSNPVANFSGDITVAATNGGLLTDSTGPLTLTLNNTSNVTFAGLALRGTPSNNYRLTFTSGSLTSVNSNQLQVTNAAASQIRVTGEPTGGKTGALLAAQPSVEILDQYGNRATTDSTTQITVAIASGANGELSGTTTIPVANGVASFTDLAFVGTPGTNYTFVYTATGLTQANSAAFSVTHADANTMLWLDQPIANKTGDRIQPRLKLVDFKGNTATTASPVSITASVTGSNGSLVNATGNITAGIITFNNLQLVGAPGTSYTIAITADMGATSITSAASSSLVLAHAVPAEFIVDDSAVGGLSGSTDPQDPALTTVPKLIIRDRFHNIATSDNSTRVTVSIASGIGGTLSGTTTVTAVNGVATFTGLVFAGVPGNQYTFSYSAVAANTNTFSITDSTAVTVSKRSDVTLGYTNQAYSPNATVAAAFTTDNTGAYTKTFSITDASKINTVCTINASTGAITIKGAGSCPVRVDVSATTYYRAHYAVATLTIAKAAQAALTITSSNEVFYMQDALMGLALLEPAATGGSTTNAVRFYASGDCRLISGKLITGNAGSDCEIAAKRTGDANYNDVWSDTQVITVKKVEQAALSIANPTTASVGDVELFTTGGSGEGAVSYTVDTAGTANCSIIDGTKLRAAANGTCQIFATKAASTNFNSKITALKTFTFNKLAQSIAFTSTIPQSPVRGVTYNPVAVASSGGVVTYAITTGNGTACEFDAAAAAATPSVTKINFLASGTCTITATQSGGSTYVSATATQTIQVGQLNQTISFAALAEKTYGTPDFMVSATSNSGLTVAFTVGSSTTNNACTVTTSGLVTLQHEGLCEIKADQAGNATYAAAPTVRQNFYVRADLAGKPKITSISVANQTFTATFTAPSYLGGADALKYRLLLTATDNGDQYANSNCSATPTSGTTYTCTVVGLPNNIAYNAEVAAITIAGIGNYSDAVGPLTPSANPMGVTQLTAAQTSSTNLAVVWEEPVVLDAQLLTYEVYVAPLGAASFPSTPAATTDQLNANITIASSPMASVSVSGGGFRTASVSTFMHRTVSTPTYSATGYQVKVVTVTQNYNPNTSPTSEYQTFGQQIGLLAPSTPRSLTLTPAGSGLFISWATPLSDGGSPIASYDVLANGTPVVGCAAITTTTCDALTTLTPYTDYVITVVARSAADLTSAAASATHDVEPAPAPPAPPAPVQPTPTPTPTQTSRPTPSPTQSSRPTPAPTQTAAPTPVPTQTQVPTSSPSAAPAPSPSFTPPTDVKPIQPAPGVTVAPQPTEVTNPIEALAPTIELPTINPGEPVANPAIGATGDDSAPPQEFSPLSSPEGVAAATETATQAVTMVSAVAAAAAAAAAGAAAAAAAAGASAAAGAASSASAAGSAAGGAAGGSTGGGNTGGNTGGSSSSTSSEAGRRPEDFSGGEDGEGSEGEDDPESIDVTQDNITIERESWGDKLAMFSLPFITFLDRRSHNAAERIAKFSPFFAKLINDGAYLRAMLGTISTALPIASAIIALAAVADNAAEIAAGDYSKIITPAWFFLLAIATLGAFDAAAGFTGAMVFIIGSVITVGHVPDSNEIRTMMGIMLVSVGPALLTTGFRTIRKHAALNFNAWWERIADFVIAPFMAGWSVSAMISGLPALAGLTLDVANHVNDFVFFIAIAIFIRVALEELAAAGYPARLNRINPDEIPDPSILQRSIVLVIKYFVWVFIGGALIGPSWQVWVGSALFVFPTVVGWFTDKFPNSPRIWRILPTGIPGLAFTLFVASATSAIVGAVMGTNPDLGKWSFVILPIPMLAITVLGWFGRHGEIDADGNEEERPGKRNKWVYRIGGVAVMVLTLKLAGVI